MRMIVLHFDGSCWPNPGGEATFGWRLSDGCSTTNGCGPVLSRYTSNNIAEWSGLEAGLKALADFDSEAEHLVICGDSMLVVKQLRKEWRCKKSHLQSFRDRCLGILKESGLTWEVRWIPRSQNEECDRLANSCRRTPGMPEDHRKKKAAKLDEIEQLTIRVKMLEEQNAELRRQLAELTHGGTDPNGYPVQDTVCASPL